MSKNTILIVAIIAVLVAIAYLYWSFFIHTTEQPEYTVVAKYDDIEVRQYSPMLIAEVTVEGSRDEAINEGFRLLADYIFGNNTVDSQISMTAPVQQQKSKKIAMTAPVQQQAEGSASWTISFVMPSRYTMETLPKPNRSEVTIRQVPETTYAVIRYSGSQSDDQIYLHEKKLKEFLSQNEIETDGTAKYAFYNPPWTPPFLKRNEVMIEVEKDSSLP